MTAISISRRQIYLLWCLALFLVVVLLIQPISYTIMRLAIAILIVAIWVGIFYLWWRRVAIRIVAITISLLLLLVAVAPDRPVNIAALRSEYIQQLHTYTGTPYVWGGENRLGIDCSGLVRQGLIRANLQQGIVTLNPTLVRRGLAMWWFDLSAMALRDGDRGWTYRLFQSPSINQIDLTKLLPGDLATTIDGQHILSLISVKISGLRPILTTRKRSSSQFPNVTIFGLMCPFIHCDGSN
jgi:NlpC/P60 family